MFLVKKRPSVDPLALDKNDRKPWLVISADFELGWAFRYAKQNRHPLKMAAQTRSNFPFLIKMFDDYSIPITWATVGHLFLEKCKRGDHDWMRRIPHFENRNWSYKSGDWFDCDPYTEWTKAKEWYAPDLIEDILSSKPEHEIGCHSFSHIDFTYDFCPPEVAEDEIKACIELFQSWGIQPKSFVFPGGTYGNFEVLKSNGFFAYRKRMNFELNYSQKDDFGLTVIPSSCGLGDNGLGWSKEYFIDRYEKYIDKAIDTQTICHFWFHPSLDEWFLKQVFPEILAYAAEKRDKGELFIGTMAEITEQNINLDN